MAAARPPGSSPPPSASWAPPSGSGNTGLAPRCGPTRRTSPSTSSIDRAGGLLGPLDFRQVAPPGWLVLVKGTVTLFGDGERALRLIPLLGSLVALPLCWYVARSACSCPASARRSRSASWRRAPRFIFYAAQVKPYSTDVAVALLLTALALPSHPGGSRLGTRARPRPHGRHRAVGVVPRAAGRRGPASRARRRSAREGRPRATPAARAGGARVGGERRGPAGVGAATVTPDDVLYMQRFWARAFLPLPPTTLRDLAWPVIRLSSVYGGGGLRLPVPGVFLVLAGIGSVGTLAAPLATARGCSSVRSWPRSARPRSTSTRSRRASRSSSSRRSSC